VQRQQNANKNLQSNPKDVKNPTLPNLTTPSFPNLNPMPNLMPDLNENFGLDFPMMADPAA